MIIMCITILVGLNNFTGSSIFWELKSGPWASMCPSIASVPSKRLLKPLPRFRSTDGHRVARGQRKVQTELFE